MRQVIGIADVLRGAGRLFCGDRADFQLTLQRLVRIMRTSVSGSVFDIRGIAQSGSAPGLGPGCRRFESFYPDHMIKFELLARARTPDGSDLTLNRRGNE